MPFYCSGSGQSVFTGPGSYNASEAFNKNSCIKTPGIMVSYIILILLETYIIVWRQGIWASTLHYGWWLNKVWTWMDYQLKLKAKC